MPERKTVESEDRPRTANVDVEEAIAESMTVVILGEISVGIARGETEVLD